MHPAAQRKQSRCAASRALPFSRDGVIFTIIALYSYRIREQISIFGQFAKNNLAIYVL
jgi:hypothetical protein